jgi:glycosyltransferase involved in cell wall biosynthesis
MKRLRVVHVSPTYFSAESVIGGGERFVEELARAEARYAEVKLVSFGRCPFREQPLPHLERVVLRSWTRDPMTPFSPRLLGELVSAEVVHCHQYHVLPTFLAALIGRALRQRVFVTDLGGGGWTPAYHVDQSRWIRGHLPLSEYAARGLAANQRFEVIYGGVDLDRYPMRSRPEHDGSLVFVGRILPHKGVHVLLEALRPGQRLTIVGPASDPAYLARLQDLAQGRDVQILHGLDDAAVSDLLRGAMALVHPTPTDASGDAGANELFGLALVEAMASGCPVVASSVASLPEIVSDGETGFLVPPNSPIAISDAVTRLRSDQAGWARMSRAARARVEGRFTWDAVARRCLDAYARRV